MEVTTKAALTQLKVVDVEIRFDDVINTKNNKTKLASADLLPIFKVYSSLSGEVDIINGSAIDSFEIPLISAISFKYHDQSFNFKVAPTNKKIIDNNNVVVDYNGKTTFKVRVIDNGKPVGKNVAIVMKISNKKYIVKTDKKGWASIKLSLLPGKYKIISAYKGFAVKNTIKVKNVLIAKSASMKKAKKIKYSVALKSSKGKSIVGKKITFKVNGKKYYVQTNAKGIATVSLKNLKVGKYPILVKYLNYYVKVTLKVKR